jgi:hypothetical protein
MKRKFIGLILLALISFNLTGCFNTKTSNNTTIDTSKIEILSHDELHNASVTTIYIIKDKDTKVEYILTESIHGLSIIPRLQSSK